MRSYKAKESFKWEASTHRVVDRLGDLMSRVVVVCDRESDIYEYLSWLLEKRYRFVLRATWGRGLLESDQDVW